MGVTMNVEMVADDSDVGELPDGVVLAAACEAEGLRRRAEGLLITQMMEVDRRGLFAANGYVDVAGWGRGELRWSAVEARSRKGLMQLARAVPEVLQRLLDGRLGVAQAHLLGRLFRAPRVGRFVPQFIESFLQYAAELDFAGFEQYCRSWRSLMDQDGADPGHATRSASRGFVGHDFRLVMSGPAVDGVQWDAVLNRFERVEFERDWREAQYVHGDNTRADLLERTSTQRRYDALQNLLAHVQLPKLNEPARGAGEGDDDASTGDDAPASASGGPVQLVVNVMADLNTWLYQLDRVMGLPGLKPMYEPFGAKRGRSHTVDGVEIHPRDVVLASLVDKVRCVVLDGAGRPIKMTSASRFFTGALADAALMAATRCTHPGCEVPSTQSQHDHLVAYSDGGATSSINVGPGCRRHNPWRYQVRARTDLRDDGVWVTEHANGRRIAPPD